MLVVPEPSERWTTLTSLSGSVTPGVRGGDLRVVPLRDRPEEQAGDDVRRHLERGRQALEVVGDDDRPEGGRDLDGLAVARGGRDLAVLEERVGGAEVDGVLGPALDPAAGPDRLVVQLHPALGVVVLAHLREEREDERRSGAVELAIALRAAVGDLLGGRLGRGRRGRRARHRLAGGRGGRGDRLGRRERSAAAGDRADGDDDHQRRETLRRGCGHRQCPPPWRARRRVAPVDAQAGSGRRSVP